MMGGVVVSLNLDKHDPDQRSTQTQTRKRTAEITKKQALWPIFSSPFPFLLFLHVARLVMVTDSESSRVYGHSPAGSVAAKSGLRIARKAVVGTLSL